VLPSVDFVDLTIILPSRQFENIQMSDAEIAELAQKAKAAPALRGIGLLEFKYMSVMDDVAMSEDAASGLETVPKQEKLGSGRRL
jgi:hypothetical protein